MFIRTRWAILILIGYTRTYISLSLLHVRLINFFLNLSDKSNKCNFCIRMKYWFSQRGSVSNTLSISQSVKRYKLKHYFFFQKFVIDNLAVNFVCWRLLLSKPSLGLEAFWGIIPRIFGKKTYIFFKSHAN